MIDNSTNKIEKVDEQLQRSQLDATQLAQVPVSTLKQTEDVMHLKQIKTMLAQIEKTNEIKNVAMSW